MGILKSIHSHDTIIKIYKNKGEEEQEKEKVLLAIKWWMKKYKEKNKKQKLKNCEWYNPQFF